MSIGNTYFPGIYPQDFNPPLAGIDYNPSIADWLNLNGSSVLSSSATSRVYQLATGVRVALEGTNFAFSGNEATGGTLASIRVYMGDGETLLTELTGIGRPLVDFFDARDAYGPFDVGAWLLSGNDVLNAIDADGGVGGSTDLYGFDGDDTLIGGSGDDFLDGGSGTDSFDGGAGSDQISYQQTYNDRSAKHGITVNVTSPNGDGTIIDPWGNSETFTRVEGFRGTQFADSFTGSSADESFMGLGGRDTIDGGGGSDMVRYDRDNRQGGTLGVTVNLNTGVAIDSFGRQDTLLNIENIRATESADSLTGNASTNFIYGFGGNDVLDGGTGSDWLYGGNGADRLFGGDGADSMTGGAGDDIYVVDNVGDTITEFGLEGIDEIYTIISTSLVSNVEDVILSNTTESAVGNALANRISGNASANYLVGAEGNDTIRGFGGNDRLIGGAGQDTLSGGTESDKFIYNARTEGGDTVTDFLHNVDDFVFLGSAFGGLAAGALNPSLFQTGVADQALTPGVRFFYEEYTRILRFDPDGSGGAASIGIATLQAGATMSASDFLIA